MAVKLTVKSSRLHKQKKLKGYEAYMFDGARGGTEPTRLAAHDFESRSSANSDTLAYAVL